MPKPARRLMLFAAAAALAGACGAGATATSPSAFNLNDAFTGSVDSASFSAPPGGISATASSSTPGSVSISATSGANLNFDTMIVRLGFLGGPGTYPLGVNPATTPGGTVQLLTSINGAVSSFTTPLSGLAGSVIITAVTGTSISGTFTAGVPPTPPETGEPHAITGSFNVPLTGGFVPATAANPGDSVMATLNGTTFIAGSVTATATGTGFTLTATTMSATGSMTTITMAFPQTTVGVYPFSSSTGPAVAVTVTSAGMSDGGGGAGDVGSVVIASDSAAGVVEGTFSGALAGGLAIVNGQFTVKLPPGS